MRVRWFRHVYQTTRARFDIAAKPVRFRPRYAITSHGMVLFTDWKDKIRYSIVEVGYQQQRGACSRSRSSTTTGTTATTTTTTISTTHLGKSGGRRRWWPQRATRGAGHTGTVPAHPPTNLHRQHIQTQTQNHITQR